MTDDSEHSDNDSDKDFKTRSLLPQDRREPLSRKVKSKNPIMAGDDPSELAKLKKQAADIEAFYKKQISENDKAKKTEGENMKKILLENSQLKELNNKLNDQASELQKQLKSENSEEIQREISLKKIEEEEKELQARFKAQLDALHGKKSELFKTTGAMPKPHQTSVNLLTQNFGDLNASMTGSHSLTNTEQSNTENNVNLIQNEFVIHPSATQIAKIVGVLGDESGRFPQWMQGLKSFLEIYQVWVDPNRTYDELNNIEKAKSRAARRLLNLCVEGNSNSEIERCPNSISAINALKTLHDANTATNRIEAQHRVSTTVYKEGECMATHIAKLRKAFDDLSRYDSPTTQKWQVDQLINSLPLSMNGLKNMFASWPAEMYTFERVATNLRESYNRDKLSQVMMTSASRTDTSYATENRYNRSRYQPDDDDRSRLMKFKNEKTNGKFRNRSNSRDRNNRSNRFRSNSPHRSHSRDHSSSSKNNARGIFSENKNSNEEYREASSSMNEFSLSSAAYHQHSGYMTNVISPVAENNKKKKIRILTKRRAKRFLRNSDIMFKKNLISDKKLMSEICRPVKFNNHELEPQTLANEPTLPINEHFPTYPGWKARKRVRFETIGNCFDSLADDPTFDKRELSEDKNQKRKIGYLESLKSTVVTVPVENNTNLGFRKVYDFPPLTIRSNSNKNVQSKLFPSTQTETQANAQMFMEIYEKTQPKDIVTQLDDLSVADEDDVIDIDEDVLLEEIEHILHDPPNKEIKSSETYFTAFHSAKIDSHRSDWIIDSGASIHMSYNESLFHEVNFGNFGHVVVADGNRLEIQGKGTIILNINTSNEPTTLRLENVALVPNLSCNLLSVKSLNFGKCHQKDITVVFHGNSVSLKTKTKTFQIGSWKMNAYVLNEMTFQAAPCAHEWHRRLSHRNIPDIKKAANRLNIKITRCTCSDDCDACIRAKQPNQPFRHTAEKPKSRLDIIVSDLSGPYPLSHAGSKYYMSMIDLATDYTEVWCLRHKNEAAKAIMQYVAKQENLLGNLIKVFRTDRGTEYCTNELTEFFANKGIVHQLTCPESPQQNGVAERLNRTLHDAIRAQLMSYSLCDSLWSEALHHTVYTLNRLPRDNCESSPIDTFYGRKFGHQFYEFGRPCYVSVRKIKLTKLNERSRPMRFVGIDSVSKGFRVWDGHKIWVERNVRFTSSLGPSVKTFNDEIDESSENFDNSTNVLQKPSHSVRRRSPRLLERNRDENSLLVLPTGCEPTTYHEALNSEDKDHWQEAIKAELLNCKTNRIWTKVKKPDKRHVIGCRWVFKIKRDELGNTKSYKARIVAKGFSQTEGIDYEETFAAVATSASLRLLLTKSSKEKLFVKQFDVTAAFLNGMLKEEIFMKPPPGFEEGDFVLKLEKSIYGLKQAANVWYNTLSDALQKIGFVKSETDSCLHMYKHGHNVSFIVTHVDDLLWIGNTAEIIDDLAQQLGKSFELKDLGNVHHFLGLDIQRDDQGHFSIGQAAYIDKIAESYALEDLKPQSIPINAGYYKLDHESKLSNNHQYRSLIGSLLYVAVNSRPDVAAAINILAQKTSNPSEMDYLELKHVLAYLMSTKKQRLKLYNKDFANVPLTGYSDADWGEDKETRKSVSGILCLVFGAPIIWASRKQHCVALSSTEAEYYAAGDTIKNLIWLQGLLKDVDIVTTNPITLHCDNQSCVKLTLKSNTKKSKHFDMNYHFVKDEVKTGRIILSYVPTDINPADLLTKPLTKGKLTVMKQLYRLSDD